MGLFNSTCCPSKPKRTMEYILNWIDTNSLIISKNTSSINDLLEWRRSIENGLYDHVKDVADEYIAGYPWSEVPQFDALSRDIATKADKTIPIAADSIALLDVNGNLKDSEYKVSAFAAASHTHSQIMNDADENAAIKCRFNDGEGQIEVKVQDDGGFEKQAVITYDNIDNLNRALEAPDDTPESGSDNLITSNAVYGALSGKASSSSVNSLSARIGLLESYLLTNKWSIKVDITRGYDGTNYYYIIKNGGNNVVSASTAKYVTLQNIDEIFRLAKTGDTIRITTIDGNVILSGTISEKSLGAIKVSSAFDDQYIETFFPGTGTLTLSVSTQS